MPDATFTSHYGRPIVTPSPWTADIPASLFMAGPAEGASAGRRHGPDRAPDPPRLGPADRIAALTGSSCALVRYLSRPSRFHDMRGVAKAGSPTILCHSTCTAA